MAKLFNLARMTVTSTGTGALTLGVAVAGYLTFALAGAVDGDVVAYGIRDGSNSEAGQGTVGGSGTTLTRTVSNSTNGGSPISVTTAAQVYITPRKEDFYNIHYEDSGTNTIANVLKLTRSSSAAPAVGIGAALAFEVETAANNLEIGASIAAAATNVTGAAEQFDLIFSVMDSGALGEEWRITAAGTLVDSGSPDSFRAVDDTLFDPKLQVLHGDVSLVLGRYTIDGDGVPHFILARSNNDVFGTHTALGAGDEIGRISAQASNGTSFFFSAQIRFVADAAHSASSTSGRIAVFTTPSGTTNTVEALRIENTGTLQMMNNSMVNVRGTAGDKSHGILWDSVLDGLQIRGFAGMKFMRGTDGAIEMARFDSSSHFILGGTATLSIGGSDAKLQSYGTDTPTGGLALGMFSATATTCSHLDFYRSKSGTLGAATVVAQDDALGSINWFGAQQTGTFASQTAAARIIAEVDGTVTSGSSGDMPTRLKVLTTPDGSGNLAERLRIDSPGHVIIGGAATTYAANLQVVGANGDASSTVIGCYDTGSGSADLILQKSQNATIGSHTIVAVDQALGYLSWAGSDGTQFQTASQILTIVEGVTANTSVWGRLVLGTTASGGTNPTEAIRIDSSQRVLFTGNPSYGITAITGSTDNPGFQIGGATATKGTQAFIRFSNDSNGPRFVLAKTRGQTSSPHGATASSGGTTSKPSSGDSCGDIAFNASDETNFELVGRYRMVVDGTIADNDTPGRHEWHVTPAGSNSPDNLMRLSNGGFLRVGVSGTPQRRLHLIEDDGTTNAVSHLMRLTHSTTGTPAIGISAGIEFDVEGGGGNKVGTTIEAMMYNVTSGQETFSLDAKVMASGALQDSQGLTTLNRILSANTAYTNNNTVQQWFASNGALQVEGSTTYEFEGLLLQTNGTTSHTVGLSFTGTATLTSIAYWSWFAPSLVNATIATGNTTQVTQATNTVVTAAITTAGTVIYVQGIVRINAAGTFIPNFTFSATPGTGNLLNGTYFKMRKIGSGSVTAQGRWT